MHIKHTNTDIRNYLETEHELQSKGIKHMMLQDEVNVLDVHFFLIRDQFIRDMSLRFAEILRTE